MFAIDGSRGIQGYVNNGTTADNHARSRLQLCEAKSFHLFTKVTFSIYEFHSLAYCFRLMEKESGLHLAFISLVKLTLHHILNNIFLIEVIGNHCTFTCTFAITLVVIMLD